MSSSGWVCASLARVARRACDRAHHPRHLDLGPQQIEIVNLAPEFEFDLAPSAGGIMMTALNDAVFVPEPYPVALQLACLATLTMLTRQRQRRTASIL
ncbi:MAG: hypothetical protein JRG95_25445 [Deltaproteobacteria bacterium]|nr:hypothetical protein [Deltaproteobacteria bacterium]